jgi:hypothetical protein
MAFDDRRARDAHHRQRGRDRVPQRAIGRGHDGPVAMGRGQRLVHAVQLGEIPPRRGAGVAGELEVNIEIHARGIEAAEVVAGDVAHAGVVGRGVEGVLVGGVAAIEVRPALVGHELDRPAEPSLPVLGQPLVVADPLERRGDVGTRVGDHPIDRRGGGVGRPLLVGGRDGGGDGDRVEGSPHALDDPVGDPIDGGPSGRDAREPIHGPGAAAVQPAAAADCTARTVLQPDPHEHSDAADADRRDGPRRAIPGSLGCLAGLGGRGSSSGLPDGRRLFSPAPESAHPPR